MPKAPYLERLAIIVKAHALQIVNPKNYSDVMAAALEIEHSTGKTAAAAEIRSSSVAICKLRELEPRETD